MSDRHSGNLLNQISFEEHDGSLFAKKTSLVSAATIYAVVNTGAAGVQNSMVTLNQGPNFVGLVTVHHGTGLVTLAPSPNFIGLISVAQPISTTFSGNVTLDAGSRTAIAGNVTLSDSKGFIGLVSVGNRVDLNSNITLNASPNFIGLISIAQPISTTFSGNVTLDAGSKTGIAGNVTLSDSKGFIGLVSVGNRIDLNSNVTLNPSVNWVGFATVAIGSGGAGDGAILDGTDATIKASVTSIADGRYLHVGIKSNSTVLLGNRIDLNSNVTLNASPNYIGLVTVGNRVDLNSNVTLNASANYIGLASVNIGGTLPALSAGAAYAGLMTIDIGSNRNVSPVGNVTLSDAKTYIGLTTTTLGVGDRYIGLVTATSVGLQTLASSPNFIGLATVRPDFGSNVTIHTQVFSATGNTTIFVAPASNRFFLTNLHVASLGRSEIEIRSGATTLIPFTGLATTGGYIHNFGQPGLPSRAQADALVANLNGAATVSIMAAWYAQP